MTDTTSTPTPETIAEGTGLHVLAVEQILEGASTGLEALPLSSDSDDRDLLLANYAIAVRLLKAAGFEHFCGAVAGIDSGSSWMNDETGEIVHVNVRDWNLVTASPTSYDPPPTLTPMEKRSRRWVAENYDINAPGSDGPEYPDFEGGK